ncbi:SDR family NAD(P)-dependent oxidoreductase [Actinacidiphila oryziradicis]|uniref:SDR family oxidoreductase n=1 Tax=Actinacidiphila oryziradicis TaxID=2571141 RepID=A0A4V5N1R0_9ACTN|nr:SDR family NAD(P)-dependent oxidoreductase [Actinacidiphila oryziradicis]TKA10909.1 SDR family oxidoreductase [Actinacidiphila oryziradicis]
MSESQLHRSDEKVAVVTGAGQGIGYAIAAALAPRGVRVVVTDRNPETGAAAAKELGCAFLPLDVSDPLAVTATANEVVRRFGHVDILVNNAGIAHEDAALDVTDEVWNRILSVDLTGTFVACREFGRHFVRQRSGSIVNISSIAAFIGSNPEYHVAYDVAKAGVAQMARSLAVEWAQYGVRVNAVAPGRTRTPILDTVGMDDPERMTQWIEQIPMRRLLEADEIASAVAFIALDGSAVTGQTLLVDGGQIAQ